MLVIQAILYFTVPLILEALKTRFSIIEKAGVVTLCYIVGLIIGNLPFLAINTGLAETIIEAVVALAIPLLLFKTDFKLIRSSGRGMTLAFLCCIVSIFLSAIFVTLLLSSRIPLPHVLGGMVMGVYTGGTLNMSAIGVALDAPEDLFVLMNAADMVYGGLLLIFFLSVSHRVFSLFLRKNPIRELPESSLLARDSLSMTQSPVGFGIAILVVGIAAGISILAFGEMRSVIILLLLTTLGLTASLNKRIHALKGSFVIGNYLLYVFCVAVGSLANVEQMLRTGGSIIVYVGLILATALAFYAVLTKLFRVDTDSAIIASVAGLYGPAFVPPVAKASGSMYLIPLGIAFSLVGFAIGNYLGVGVASLLELWIE